jgi:lipopolysaccharide biosynthesis glycosyltransferase
VIRVAMATDGRYVPWAATTILSIVDHEPPGSVEVNLIHAGTLDADVGRRLIEFGEHVGCDVRLHHVGPQRLSELPDLDRFGRVVWLRFLLPELLPAADRVLYLDADTFIAATIAPLWRHPLDGSPLAAVANVVEPTLAAHVSGLGLEVRTFFNSGVLLMDLDAMRSEDIWGRVLSLVADRGERLVWPDQDALNILFRDRWMPLHPRWNVMNSFWTWPYLANDVFGAEVVAQVKREPAIVHFEGPSLSKPWHFLSNHPWRASYRETLARTPWADAGVEGRTMVNRLIGQLPSQLWIPAFRRVERLRGRLGTLGRRS